MRPDEFVKVFDILDSGYRSWDLAAPGLIFIAVGLVFFFFPKILKATRIPYLDAGGWHQKVFRYGLLGFAVVWTVVVFAATYAGYIKHRAQAQEGACGVVEGRVENFVPMPYGGHAMESFSVAGVTFEYSDYIVTNAFNNASSHGGPIRPDSYVRICYDPADKAILRLEIRGFSGERKDYSSQGIFGRLFPSLEGKDSVEAPEFAIPWSAAALMALAAIVFALDFIALQSMHLPYVRTFLRVGTKPVEDCAMPAAVRAQPAIKLRNNLIYWDKEDRAIWLRPRGLNRVGLPMVAKLLVDPQDRFIVASQSLMSSGSLLATAIFFCGAAIMIAAGPGRAVSWPLFAGAVVLIVIFTSLLTVRTFKSRLEPLVQDALKELRTMQP